MIQNSHLSRRKSMFKSALFVVMIMFSSSAIADTCACRGKEKVSTIKVSKKGKKSKTGNSSVFTPAFIKAVKRNQAKMSQKTIIAKNEVRWEDLKNPGICYTHNLQKIRCP